MANDNGAVTITVNTGELGQGVKSIGNQFLTYLGSNPEQFLAALNILGIIFAFIGMVLVAKSIFMAIDIANDRSREGFAGALWTSFIGFVMLALPEAMSITAETIGAPKATSITAYAKKAAGSAGQMSELAFTGAMFVIVLLGWIAFARGWMIIRAVTAGSGGNATVGHGIVFIVAGCLCAHIPAILSIFG